MIDIMQLRIFYRSPRGLRVASSLAAGVAQNVRIPADWECAGIGYTQPVINPKRLVARRYIQFMPAQMGIARWEGQNGNICCLAYETELPLPDMSLDAVFVQHWFEHSPDPVRLLHECWRVLNGAGHIFLLLPARRGLWVYDETTPFGLGRPYTSAQINTVLRQTGFEPLALSRHLYWPPGTDGKIARLCSHVLPRIAPRLSGVLLVEAQKTILALHPRRLAKIPRPLFTGHAPQPAPARATVPGTSLSHPKPGTAAAGTATGG